MKISNKDYLEITQRFVIKNFLLVAGGSLLVFVFVIFSIMSQNSKLEDMKKILNENTSKVIGLTDNGTVVEIEKQKMIVEQERNTVARALKLLIVSRSEITKGFSISEFKTPISVLENSENLQEFFEYVMLQDKQKGKSIVVTMKNDSGKYEETDALTISNNGMGFLNAYLEALKIKTQANTLPHFISINSSKINSFEEKDNTFKIDMTIDVTLQTWVGKDDLNKNKYETKIGKYNIIATGYFDLRTRTILSDNSPFKGYNKLGLHFNTLKIIMPEGSKI
ncbi:MAG: hypothetical protein M0R46_09900 [Candidatus Muirbacterium halophilum]|nr:hypothetical protein [Candidatus Muirbacterium halophilum]